MSDELKQMILRYLADMADRGDYEAKKNYWRWFPMIDWQDWIIAAITFIAVMLWIVGVVLQWW